MGPQVAYFMPQILIEMDLHGPDIDAQGAAFPGVSPYVLLGPRPGLRLVGDLGRARTSSTRSRRSSASPTARQPDVQSTHYLYKGECRAMETLTRVNNITPNPGDPSPPETLHARGAAHRARHRLQARHRRRTARRVRAPALDLLPRGRLGARVRGPQPPVAGPERRGLPAGDAQDQLHLQLVLRRRPRHRLLQLGRQPGARRRAPTPTFPNWGTGEYDWQGWETTFKTSDVHALRGAPAGGQPGLHHLLEQQAGARLRLRRRPVGLRPALPLAVARRARSTSGSPAPAR